MSNAHESLNSFVDMSNPQCDNCNLDPHGYGLLCLGNRVSTPAHVMFLRYPIPGQTGESVWISLSVTPHGVFFPGFMNLRNKIVTIGGEWDGNGFFKQRWVLDLETNAFGVQPGDDISVKFDRRSTIFKVPGRLLPGCR